MILRPARPDELERVAAAATGIFRAPPRAGDLAREYPLLFDPGHAERLWIAEEHEGGAILAHAGYALLGAVAGDRRQRVACFGAVFTAESRRGQGLATRVLEQAIRAARAEGAQLGLISGSRPLYRRLGFEPLPPVAFHAAGPGELIGPELRVEPAEVTDADALAALYDREPIRFERSPGDWARLLEAGTVFYGPGSIWVVRRDGRVAAYAALEGRPPGPAPRYRAVEVGGDRELLADAIPDLATRLGAHGIAVVDLPHDRTLAAAADSRGWPRVELSLPLSAQWWDPSLTGAALPWYGLNYV